MIDLSQQTIKDLFYQQVHRMTRENCCESFDMQFSDRWLP